MTDGAHADQTGYDGDVAVGGPAQTRRAGGLEIRKLAVGPMNNNCYLLTDVGTGERLLVDAAAEPDRLMAEIGTEPLATIVTTHSHPDHWQALVAVADATGARTLAHGDDAAGLPLAPSALVADGEEITLGEQRLTVLQLRGHTPGSVALLYRGDPERPHLFTGDCLFPGGAGNTEKDPQRFTTLLDDLEAKVFGPLPDETWVYPGHGGDTTLGAERPSLAGWRERGW